MKASLRSRAAAFARSIAARRSPAALIARHAPGSRWWPRLALVVRDLRPPVTVQTTKVHVSNVAASRPPTVALRLAVDVDWPGTRGRLQREVHRHDATREQHWHRTVATYRAEHRQELLARTIERIVTASMRADGTGHRFTEPAAASLVHHVRAPGAGAAAVLSARPSTVPIRFTAPPTTRPSSSKHDATTVAAPPAVPSSPTSQAAAPPIDVEALSDQVIRTIDRRISARRERFGG